MCTIRLGAFDSTADWWWWWAWSRGQWSRWVASDKPDVADTAQPSTSRDAPHTAKAEPATRSRWVRRGGRAAAAGPPTRPSRLDEAASKGRLRSRQSPSSEPGSPWSLSRLRCPTAPNRPAQLMGGGTGTEGRNSPPQPSHITCQRGRPLPLSPSAASLPSPSSCWPPISQWRCRCSASLLVLVQALTPLRRQGCGQRRTTSTYSSSSSRLSPPLPSFAPSPSLFEACE